jgi:hypothetical protein
VSQNVLREELIGSEDGYCGDGYPKIFDGDVVKCGLHIYRGGGSTWRFWRSAVERAQGADADGEAIEPRLKCAL